MFQFSVEDYDTKLEWIPFAIVEEEKLANSQLFKFIAFSGSTVVDVDQENEPTGASFKKIKRVNSDISATSDPGVRYIRRAEVSPIVIQGGQNTRQVEIIDVHSST